MKVRTLALAHRAVARPIALIVAAMALGASLSGCGLAETSVSAVAEAKSSADAAREGVKAEARVKEQIEQAQAAAAAQRQAADQ
jgi:hypothetical protein